MAVNKKYLLRISLILLIIAAGFLCFSGIKNYSPNTSASQNNIAQRNSVNRQFSTSERNFSSQNTGQIPKGQSSWPNAAQHVAPPNGHLPNGSRPGYMFNVSSSAVTQYTPPIILYSFIFLILFIGVYWFLEHKKVKIHSGDERVLILALLCVGFLLRIYLATLINGHPFDINTFKNWATAAANNLSQVYAGRSSSDYPPLYIYVLFAIGKLASLPAMNPYFTILLKLPSMMADIASSFLIYKLARRYLSSEISILLSAFYVFNPAVFINSSIWGQVDSFFTFLIISAVFLLAEKKIGLSAILFTAAVLMKPQGIIFLPVLFFELVRQRNLKSIFQAVISALVTAVIIILPFSWNMGALWIFKLFSHTIGEYPYASVNAFNFFSLIGANYTKNTSTLFVFSYHTWGMIFIVLITAFSWFIYSKANRREYAAAVALLIIAGVFTFSTSMHERYLFPAVALSILAFIYLKDKRLLLLSAGFSATVYINTHYVLWETVNGVNKIPFNPVLIITSLLNVVLFVYLVKILYPTPVNGDR